MRVPLCVAETSDGVAHEHRRLHRRRRRHRSCARAPSCAAGSPAPCASPTSPTPSGCAPRCTASGNSSQHLCMAISNTTYYESLVTSTEVAARAGGRRPRARARARRRRAGPPRRARLPAGAPPPGHRCRATPRRSCNTRRRGMRVFEGSAPRAVLWRAEADDLTSLAVSGSAVGSCGLRGQQRRRERLPVRLASSSASGAKAVGPKPRAASPSGSTPSACRQRRRTRRRTRTCNEDRHLRRRRQRRDDAADEDPAVEPGRQGLAGRRSSASRSTTRCGWRRSRSSSPQPVKGLVPDDLLGQVAGARRPRSARSTARSTASRTTSPRSCSGTTRS